MALLAPIPCPILAVPGNHETTESLIKTAPPQLTVLHGQSTTINSITFFGIGHGIPTTPFTDWSTDLSEDAAASLLNTCTKTDILISHSPPKGVADTTSRGQSVGSTALLAAAKRLQPRLLLCGHIHEAWGQSGPIGATQVHNLGPAVNWFEV
jgi:Icc-related predicted phosphoesterase